MSDTINQNLYVITKTHIDFKAPKAEVADFYNTLEQFWTAIVDSAKRTLDPQDKEPLPEELI